VFLIAMLASSALLAFASPIWLVIFSLQILFYMMAALAWKHPALEGKLLRVPYYFTMVNLAAWFGLLRGIRRKQKPVWMRTERFSPESRQV
jgi:hypothetical protein